MIKGKIVKHGTRFWVQVLTVWNRAVYVCLNIKKQSRLHIDRCDR